LVAFLYWDEPQYLDGPRYWVLILCWALNWVEIRYLDVKSVGSSTDYDWGRND
jgi:hypothetical protein